MENIINKKIKQEQKALDQACAGYMAENDTYYQDLYLADIEKAADEIVRLSSLLLEISELDNFKYRFGYRSRSYKRLGS